MAENTLHYMEVPVDSLKPYKNNARTHSDAQIEQIAKSILEFGFLNPVLINSQHEITAGHGRVLAAKKLGLEMVPCLLEDHLTPEQRRAYILADNRIAENAGWDMELVGVELEDLNLDGFDITLTGFDESTPLPSAETGGAQEEADWFSREEKDGKSKQEGNEEYNAFVEKFEPKKTTDDCYTPDVVYEAVAGWVSREYGLARESFCRPFYPGGDYTRFDYAGKIVVDNPPFSILAEIRRFFMEHGVRYFLFAPGLTLIASRDIGDTHIAAHAKITYENGAAVTTSFVTNLEDAALCLRTAPELHDAVEAASAKNLAEQTKQQPEYTYPDAVFTSSQAGYLSAHGVDFRLQRADCVKIRELDAMKDAGKGIFGGGLLLSEQAAAEKAAAEKAAAERAAAEKAAAERAAAEKADATKWELSEREWEIVRSLGAERQQRG